MVISAIFRKNISNKLEYKIKSNKTNIKMKISRKRSNLNPNEEKEYSLEDPFTLMWTLTNACLFVRRINDGNFLSENIHFLVILMLTREAYMWTVA